MPANKSNHFSVGNCPNLTEKKLENVRANKIERGRNFKNFTRLFGSPLYFTNMNGATLGTQEKRYYLSSKTTPTLHPTTVASNTDKAPDKKVANKK
ncbi:Uncharacterised protein [Streptococcus agalactiae]|nr:Uncharacterised protein [Streptococcus agalactiae]